MVENKRQIAKRILSRDLFNAIIHREDDYNTKRITSLLLPAGRVKLVGVVISKRRVGDNDEFAVIRINDMFATIKLFITDPYIVDKVANINVGDVVQVIGKMVQNKTTGRIEVHVEGINKVDPIVYINHIFGYIDELREHKEKLKNILEYYNVQNEISILKAKGDKVGVVNKKKKLVALKELIGKEYMDMINIYDRKIMEELMSNEFFEDEIQEETNDELKTEVENEKTEDEIIEDYIEDTIEDEFDETYEISDDEEDTVYI